MADQGVNRTAFDTSLYGGTDSTGAINQVFGKDAISNAVILWLTSKKGDVIRNPEKGGVVFDYLTKPLSDVNADSMRTVIFASLETDFEPQVIVDAVEVTPDYEKRKWIVNIELYSPTYKTEVTVNTALKNLN